ncbi:MAG: hypothetical protein ACFFED_04775 [Candidatus Thorarchaeota archaeon]
MSDEDKERVNDKTLGAAICICLMLAPFTLGLSLFVLFGIFCISAANSQANERRSVLNEAMMRSYRIEQDEQDIIEKMHSAYILPEYCQNCGNRVILCKLKWLNESTALCPSCEAVLRTIVI